MLIVDQGSLCWQLIPSVVSLGCEYAEPLPSVGWIVGTGFVIEGSKKTAPNIRIRHSGLKRLFKSMCYYFISR